MRGIAIAVSVVTALVVFPGVAAAKDRDRDKLPDRWEKQHGLSVSENSAKADPDGDGLTNRQEFRCHTKPHSADSDRDKREDADEDPDRDRVDNGNEMAQGTRPFARDSDRDGVSDGREDPDRDKLVNAGEDATSNDPMDPDTDDDGIKDGNERAGTIASFTDGTLTIDLANGSQVTGVVTDATEIDCESEDEHEGSDDSHHGLKASASDDGPSDDSEESGDDGDHGDDNGDHGDHVNGDVEESDDESDDEGESTCGPADLKVGVAVHEAELRVGADGLEFEQIELVE
ncbi:MAG: hypothetical protein QOI45_988 [Thermoleophilaceae bacterium]|nr:hypothetical protein [Thermoleophilaceae bacterium]